MASKPALRVNTDTHLDLSRFATLPTELRLQIWSNLFPAPRLVSPRFARSGSICSPSGRRESLKADDNEDEAEEEDDDREDENADSSDDEQLQITSNHPPPVLLHICRESREVGLKRYQKLELSHRYPSLIYMDFGVDTLFFDEDYESPDGDMDVAADLAAVNLASRLQLRACAFHSDLWDAMRFAAAPLDEIRLLPGLETLALVMPEDDVPEWNRLTKTLSGGSISAGASISSATDSHPYRDDAPAATELDETEKVYSVKNSEVVSPAYKIVQCFVDQLRLALADDCEIAWNRGAPPNVQIWIT